MGRESFSVIDSESLVSEYLKMYLRVKAFPLSMWLWILILVYLSLVVLYRKRENSFVILIAITLSAYLECVSLLNLILSKSEMLWTCCNKDCGESAASTLVACLPAPIRSDMGMKLGEKTTVDEFGMSVNLILWYPVPYI